SPMWSPGRTPCASNAFATRVARSSSSAKVRRRSPQTTARRSGTTSATLSNKSAMLNSMRPVLFGTDLALSLVAADDPHGEELRRTAIGVPHRRAGPVDLMRAGLTAHLQRRFGEANHPR